MKTHLIDQSNTRLGYCGRYVDGPFGTRGHGVLKTPFVGETTCKTCLREFQKREDKANSKPTVPSFAPNECHNCRETIRVQIFKGSTYCSDDCRKALANG